MNNVNRRTYLKTTGVAAVAGFAGCLGDSAAATGTLATQVTDQPGDIADFESCVVTIEGIWVKPSSEDDDADQEATDDEGEATDNEDETGGDEDTADDPESVDAEDVDEGDGREYHAFEDPQEADLVQLQDGNTQLIDDRELEARTYEFLQLDVSGVDGTLEDGESAEVDTPGNAPLQFKEPFEIRADEQTTFVADFTPVRRGRTGQYLLQPVAQGTRVEYES